MGLDTFCEIFVIDISIQRMNLHNIYIVCMANNRLSGSGVQSAAGVRYTVNLFLMNLSMTMAANKFAYHYQSKIQWNWYGDGIEFYYDNGKEIYFLQSLT